MALETGCPGQAPMLSGKCWSLREPAIYLPWSQQARARSAPNQQLGHPNGDERVYDWVWMVTVFLLGGCWVNYVGANLRFTLYIYYRLGSTLYMGLV